MSMSFRAVLFHDTPPRVMYDHILLCLQITYHTLGQRGSQPGLQRCPL